MARAVKFDDLALQYVLSDEPEQAKSAAETAASMIESSANNRVLVGQWVSSINRWMPSGNSGEDGLVDIGEGQDDDFISRAKDFLASTLGALKRDTLKADQVQLLISFFCSLFSSDHKAGIAASANALRQLTSMKMFKPPMGNHIIEGICKLGDDFKLQAPATRLEIYQLVLGLLQDPSISNDLEYRHGSTCGFMTGLLDLCRNERDPNNLMKWFDALKTFLQTFSPSTEVISEVFKTFSAYFPISLRASATPSGITADDLKGAVRACFSAHHRLAGQAIPFLIEKLDQGDAVTVAVKVDILQTLDACLNQYTHPKQSVVPYADQIWSSLKYEVRNGEVSDSIEATLKAISSLTRRLDEDDLRSFFNNAWRDIAEDISNPTYAAQAGRLLVGIAGASVNAFSMITPALSHVRTTIKTSKSAAHRRDLLALLNSILLVRSHLVSSEDVSQSLEDPLKDRLFGDALFFDVHLPLWKEIPTSYTPAEQVEILSKVLEGLAALVGQQSYRAKSRKLLSDSTCAHIFNLLSEPSITYPLKGEGFIGTNQPATDDQLRDSASSALKKAVPLYPKGFQQLLLQYLASVQSLYETRDSSNDFVLEIKQAAVTLCEVACPEASKAPLPFPDYISLISTFLNGLFWMLSQQAPPKYWSALISSIHFAISRSLASMSEGSTGADSKSRPISAEFYSELSISYERILKPKRYGQGEGEAMFKDIGNLNLANTAEYQQLLVYCLCVLKQLYRRFTDVYPLSNESGGKRWEVGLHKDFVPKDENLTAQQDICLHQLGLLAASVVRALDEDEQKALQIDQEAFVFFRGDDQTADGTRLREEILSVATEFSPLHEYRTAPLSMGILQGLFPGALKREHHVDALRCLARTLTSIPSPCSDMTRAALDTTWAILSNKFVIKGDDRKSDWLALQEEIKTALVTIWNSDRDSAPEIPDAVRVFRSILHFLSGDIARFQTDPKMNSVLRLVCDDAPSNPTMGRQLARNLGLLLSPKECLQRENHAVRKRLGEAWIYHQAVQPHLGKCFPGPPGDSSSSDRGQQEQEQDAINRAVATFTLLRHARYEHYADDVAQIIRVAIRSLGTLEFRGAEMESCLVVLVGILEKDPQALKDHLAGLTRGMIKVYTEAKVLGGGRRDEALSPRDANSLNTCRKLVLDFFRNLPAIYEAHSLLPYRNQLLRPLSLSCGDPVREIRRTALAARQAWENLA
ncbi:hypothetical protein DL766_009474 [Monosporascus sp. MC13-8B]|uniref:MMS19 nucleotide excision repair protein n=1 Tax=Monosporascus cannonballus TaxID=155416 RepID=A0ABY0GWZ4_9PEZI|nr:hypothetical protein DL762_008360 [Monosporascus cannonballus]RYO99175.1 hypothetical protein DL763_001665 [Monosporascus cannonballus]RYP15175.1 hypothetical protein DL766_009474 [Monosporascus sp. MC13-8B]